MTGELNMSTLLVTALTVTPALLGGLVALLQRERQPKLYRHLSRQVEMIAKTRNDSAAQREIELLVVATASAIRSREARTMTRQLNTANVALTVFLAVTGGAASYGLLQWAIATQGSGWNVVAIGALAIVALFFALLVAAGIGTFYKPSASRDKSSKT